MNFYELSHRTSESEYPEFAHVGKLLLSDLPQCSHCGALIGKKWELPPHRYRMVRGKRGGDFLSDSSSFSLSARFVKAYQSSDLTGLEFSESPVEFKKPPPMVYYMAFPQFANVYLDMEASGAIVKEFFGCDQCRAMTLKKIDRLCIDQSSWTGEDIFLTANLPNRVLVSQNFVDFVNENKFTNFIFKEGEEVNFDYSFIK